MHQDFRESFGVLPNVSFNKVTLKEIQVSPLHMVRLGEMSSGSNVSAKNQLKQRSLRPTITAAMNTIIDRDVAAVNISNAFF